MKGFFYSLNSSQTPTLTEATPALLHAEQAAEALENSAKRRWLLGFCRLRLIALIDSKGSVA